MKKVDETAIKVLDKVQGVTKDPVATIAGKTNTQKVGTALIAGGALYGLLVDPVGGLIAAGVGTYERFPQVRDFVDSLFQKKPEEKPQEPAKPPIKRLVAPPSLKEITERIEYAKMNKGVGEATEEDELWLKLATVLAQA